MKKTLTVNLGGTVYHIDDDAYRLLDDETFFSQTGGGGRDCE